MRTLNRGALLVRLRQPYLDWAASLDEDSPALAEGLENHVSVYLVSDPEAMNEDSPDLKEHFAEIFHDELEAWSLDESQWPPRRDLKTFMEWFDVYAQSIVVELGHDPIEVEGDDE